MTQRNSYTDVSLYIYLSVTTVLNKKDKKRWPLGAEAIRFNCSLRQNHGLRVPINFMTRYDMRRLNAFKSRLGAGLV